MEIGDNVKVVPYIKDMPAKMPKVAALVSRAGATTIAEVTALGVPTILIPSPYVTANHQVKNAQALVRVKPVPEHSAGNRNDNLLF